MSQALEIQRTKIFDGEVILASQIAQSLNIKLTQFLPNGYFALDVEVSGDGAVKFEIAVPHGEGVLNDASDQTFITPTGSSAVATGVTKTSGVNSDGKDYFSVDPPLATDLQIKATETGTTNPVTVTAWLIYQ